jgi:uncharacterized protein (TIGR02453 family)
MDLFPGFTKEMPAFFKGLRENNNREWFQHHKEVFETRVKAPMVELVESLNEDLAKCAPHYVTEPKAAIFRIYRDTRFSKDKTPYKDHIGASFAPSALGAKSGCSGLYVGVSDKQVDVAGGIYMPDAAQLLAIRTMLAERHREFDKLASGKVLRSLMGELRGDQLSRIPKGFPPDHPAEALLRRKQWYFHVSLDVGVALTRKLVPDVARRFAALAPVLDFLNQPILAAAAKQAKAAQLAG